MLRKQWFSKPGHMTARSSTQSLNVVHVQSSVMSPSREPLEQSNSVASSPLQATLSKNTGADVVPNVPFNT